MDQAGPERRCSHTGNSKHWEISSGIYSSRERACVRGKRQREKQKENERNILGMLMNMFFFFNWDSVIRIYVFHFFDTQFHMLDLFSVNKTEININSPSIKSYSFQVILNPNVV